MVTFDTSALLALFDDRQSHHATVLEIAKSERGPLVVPVGIMSETTYFVEQRMGHAALRLFMEDIVTGVYTLHCGTTTSNESLNWPSTIRTCHSVTLMPR